MGNGPLIPPNDAHSILKNIRESSLGQFAQYYVPSYKPGFRQPKKAPLPGRFKVTGFQD